MTGLRWWIAGLIFLATLINFVNRLTISVLAPVLTRELHLTATEYAQVANCFLIAYTISQGLSGRVYDKVGAKAGFAISIVVWSLASMAHAFVRGLFGLNCCRFVLGLGEAGNWPGAAKVIAEWFPARQRALGMGIFNSGTSLGSVVAPPLIVWLTQRFGWQATFLVLGGAGFGWLVLWLWFYEAPERHPRITKEELQVIQEKVAQTSVCPRSERSSDARVPGLASFKAEPTLGPELIKFRATGHREAWAIAGARFLADPVWWLYITWLPLYLSQTHGFDLKQIGMFAWAPFVAADLGSLGGGWASGFLIARGWSVDRARKTVIVIGMACMSTGVMAARAQTAAGALAWIAVVLFGFQSWINNVQTLPSDYFPEDAVGSVTGMGGVGAGLGAMLLIQATGYVVDRWHTYAPILTLAAMLPLAATAVLFALGGRVRRLSFENGK